MDSVAFAFCDAVVGTIRKLPWLHVAFPDDKWNKALQDHSANRKRYQLHVSYWNDKWFYKLYNGSNALLTTLVQQVGPKYLRFDCIECMTHGRYVTETSKEKLHALIKSLKPFLNFPSLYLFDDASKFPENDLDQLLSSFAKINICLFYSSSNGRSAIEFAKQLMQQDTLVKTITILGARDLLAAAIEDYRATGRVNVKTGDFPVYETTLRFVR